MTLLSPQHLRRRRGSTARPEPTGRHPAVARPQPVPLADRLHAKDLARLEGFSERTARRLMAARTFGPVRGRNPRDRWIPRAAYHAWLLTL